MPHSRHTSSHTRPDPVSRGARKPARARRYKWFAVVAAAAVLVGTAGALAASRHEAQLASDSTTAPLFGASASSPAALAQATSEFGHLPIFRMYFRALPDANAWTKDATGINKSAVVVSFNAAPSSVLSGSDNAALSHFFDTAPTGHTLLLLDATESYHREIARKASDMPEEVLQLLPRLRDADYTRVLVVTLPEATPVHEAAMLQADLRRAQIEPFAWVINQSFAESGSRDPLLVARGHGEAQFIREVVEKHSKRTAIVPWVTEEPTGPERLQQFFKP